MYMPPLPPDDPNDPATAVPHTHHTHHTHHAPNQLLAIAETPEMVHGRSVTQHAVPDPACWFHLKEMLDPLKIRKYGPSLPPRHPFGSARFYDRRCKTFTSADVALATR